MRKNLTRAMNQSPILIDSATFTDTSGDFSFSLAGVTFDTGDLGILAISSDTYDTNVTVTGWTQQHNSNDSNPQSLVFTRSMDSGDTAIASASGASLAVTTAVLAIFRGASTSVSLTAATGATGAPNPPSATGVVSTDAVVVTAHLDDEDATLTAPSGYTLIETVGLTITTNATTTAMAYKTGASGTEDPGTFGGGAGSSQWDATTTIVSKA